MASIVAERIASSLEAANFVVMRRPAWARAVGAPSATWDRRISASDKGGFRAALFCFALVNRGRDAAWAKSYGSIG
jgi:hypothetical protein